METTSVPKTDDAGMILIKNLMNQIKEKKEINPISFVDDPSCDKHRLIIPNHQESSKRTEIIRKAIEKYKLDEFMIRSGSISLTKTYMCAVHDADYIELLIKCGKVNKPIEVPGSTEITMSDIGSLEALFAAAASVIGGVDTVCGKFTVNNKNNRYSSRRVRKVFCNVRPPGHHAHINHGSGFCFMNNVAIGAKFALDKYSSFIKKILIFDWDLHHGNGTEDIFKNDPNVMYVSFHRGGNDQDGFYPFTGTKHVNDLGNIINFPIHADETADMYMTKFREEFLPLAYVFDPDLVFISAGFDSHKDDLYHALPLDYQHFHEMTKELSKLADTCSTGRLVSVLEGGYTPNVLYKCAVIHMLTMVNGYD
jgi:acetoin utilization deacetylase AcuC-like enzyme